MPECKVTGMGAKIGRVCRPIPPSEGSFEDGGILSTGVMGVTDLRGQLLDVNTDAMRAVASCQPVSAALPDYARAAADEIERLLGLLAGKLGHMTQCGGDPISCPFRCRGTHGS